MTKNLVKLAESQMRSIRRRLKDYDLLQKNYIRTELTSKFFNALPSETLKAYRSGDETVRTAVSKKLDTYLNQYGLGGKTL